MCDGNETRCVKRNWFIGSFRPAGALNRGSSVVFNPRNLRNPPRFYPRYIGTGGMCHLIRDSDNYRPAGGLCWFVVSGERHAERAYYFVGFHGSRLTQPTML